MARSFKRGKQPSSSLHGNQEQRINSLSNLFSVGVVIV
jgi:hypothetical protein